MKKNLSVPSQIGGAKVICYTSIDNRHTFTGNCRQIVAGKLMGPMAGLAICKYDDDDEFYLLGCREGWASVTDTCHQTIEEAKEQAEFEYKGTMHTWFKLPADITSLHSGDAIRLRSARILWKNPRTRRRLLYVWEHPGHPHRERFEENRDLIVGFLECENPQAYVDSIAGEKWSLRTLTREIPCVIWEFWDESKEAGLKQKDEVRGLKGAATSTPVPHNK